MPQHYEVKSYETLQAWLAPSGIVLPELHIANQVVWGSYMHFWSPWLAYGVHLLNMKRKFGVTV